MQIRKVTYRLYPTPAQIAALDRACDLHRALYNAALQERIEAYRKAGVSIGLHDQSASLTVIRNEDPEYRALPRKALLNTLERLDLAFRAFFRRVKAGETPGFPRFKSRDRWKGFGFRTHGDGAKFTVGKVLDKHGRPKHGHLYLMGIPGLITARGVPRDMGKVKTLEIARKAGQWHLTMSVECAPVRECGETVLAFDWGVKTFVSGLTSDGGVVVVENDRIGRRTQRRIKTLSRKLARQKRGARRREMTKARLARAKLNQANQRKNRAHQTSADMVKRSGAIAFEALTIRNMTRSAKGTAEAPGRNVKQKAGLNREILDTAPANLIMQIKRKAEEAGVLILEAPTRTLKPSQTCPSCGRQEKKTLRQRVHECGCGHVEDRDLAAARVVLNWALKELAREPGQRGGAAVAAPANRETAILCEA